MKKRILSLLLLTGACAPTDLDLGTQETAVRREGRYQRGESDLISASGYHACIVRPSDGKLVCWGQNWWGELGTGTTANTSPPQVATAVTTPMIGVAVGTWHVCGLAADGHVECWGDNAYGQLGDNTTTDRMTPVTVVGVEDVVDLAAGAFHTCALEADGEVKCWGRNDWSQLGDGTTTNRKLAVTVALQTLVGGSLMNDIVDLSAGWAHSCAIKDDGGSLCWGSGSRVGRPSAIFPANAGSLHPVAAAGLSAGGYHTVAVDADGTAWSVGSNQYGALGNNTTTDSVDPVQVRTSSTAFLTNVIQVSGGSWHSCALARGGSVYCWGRNGYGQLGQGSAGADSSLAKKIATLGNVVAVASGDDFACALKGDGNVSCWGNGLYGALGATAYTIGVPSAVSMTPDDGVLDVAAGGSHQCVRNIDGTVDCWGSNGNGQVGDGTLVDKASPVQVGQLANAVDVAAGSYHTCAVLADNTARCWGKNTAGQLGDGYTFDRTLPYPVASLSDAVAIDTGYVHTCALTTTGGVKCWGSNTYGQVGDNTLTNRTTPVAITFGDALQLSTGGDHTCAINATTTGLYCWGKNISGQLGVGSYTSKTKPTAVVGLSQDVAQVAAGGIHTCALLTDGDVLCWGANNNGQLGDGTTVAKNVPVQVNIDDVVSLSAGNEHTCAIKGDGSVWCWGSNTFGQLMTGTTGGSSATPQLATGVSSDAVAIASGGQNSCVLGDDGLVTCF